MPILPGLSAADERRILGAIDAAAADADCDRDPSAALAKAAAGRDVPLGHVGIMTRAYNTARAALQREEGGSAAEKAAAFPLADAGRVRALLVPAAGGTKAAAAAPARDYALPPTWAARRAAPVDFRREFRAAAAGPRDEAAAFGRAVKAASAALADPAGGRDALAAASARAEAALARLAAGLEAAGAPGFTDVKLAAAALHGRAGERAMDAAYRLIEPAVKLAARRPYHDPADFPAIYGPLADLVAAAGERLAAGAGLAAEVAARQKAALALLDPYAAALEPPGPAAPPIPEGGSLFDAGPPAGARPPGGGGGGELDPLDAAPAGAAAPSLFDATPPGPKLAAGIPQAVGVGLLVNKGRDLLDSLMAGAREANAPSARAGRMLGKISDPDHEATLDDIDARAALATMVSHDPVLAGYDPRELARAFNEISNLAPTLSRKPLLARPLLRKSLSMGHLDSFEGGEAVKSEKNLRELAPPAPGAGPRKPEAPKG